MITKKALILLCFYVTFLHLALSIVLGLQFFKTDSQLENITALQHSLSIQIACQTGDNEACKIISERIENQIKE